MGGVDCGGELVARSEDGELLGSCVSSVAQKLITSAALSGSPERDFFAAHCIMRWYATREPASRASRSAVTDCL